jgi:WhiB family redox-sensing transcriptional regulator
MEIHETLEIIKVDSPPWMEDSLCGKEDHDPDDWYSDPEDIEGNTERARRAIAVCKQCPVKHDCLVWAYETGDTWAILGALTANQRRRVSNRVERKMLMGLE